MRPPREERSGFRALKCPSPASVPKVAPECVFLGGERGDWPCDPQYSRLAPSPLTSMLKGALPSAPPPPPQEEISSFRQGHTF